MQHKLKLEEKEHEERLEREKSKKLAEIEVRKRIEAERHTARSSV